MASNKTKRAPYNSQNIPVMGMIRVDKRASLVKTMFYMLFERTLVTFVAFVRLKH